MRNEHKYKYLVDQAYENKWQCEGECGREVWSTMKPSAFPGCKVERLITYPPCSSLHSRKDNTGHQRDVQGIAIKCRECHKRSIFCTDCGVMHKNMDNLCSDHRNTEYCNECSTKLDNDICNCSECGQHLCFNHSLMCNYCITYFCKCCFYESGGMEIKGGRGWDVKRLCLVCVRICVKYSNKDPKLSPEDLAKFQHHLNSLQ